MVKLEQLAVDLANVVQEGSNENGGWIKLRRGTMIQWGVAGTSVALGVFSGSYSFYTGTGSFNLPVSFVNALYTVVGQLHIYIPSNLIGNIGLAASTASIVNYREQWPYDYSAATRYIDWIAIGKWK